MKNIILLLSIFIMSSQGFANDSVNSDICTAFATEYSGESLEWSDEADDDVVVTYEYETVYSYCIDSLESNNPKLMTDDSGSYYEFEIFVCNGVYQYATMAYVPESKQVEDLGGSGSENTCPYASEE